MTTDIVQNRYIAQKTGTHPPSQAGIFGFLKKAPTPEQSHRDLLKLAYKKLEKAEKDLAEKSQRIETLETLLTIDELTGLQNRRGFYQAFEKDIDRTQRRISPGGLLIMIDLDNFKMINDTYGHNAGDQALRVVAECLQGSIRSMDVAARTGGDEFIILMPNTSIAKAMGRARKIGNDLNALQFDWDGNTIKLGGSLGLKEYSRGDSIDTIIADADSDMYDSKAAKKHAAQ